VILGGSIVIPAAFAFLGPEATASAAKSTFDLGFVTMPLVLGKLAFGNVFGLAWFALLFLAGITSSISLAQPGVAFLEDEFGLSKRKAVLAFAAASFLLCQANVFGLGRGVLGEFDFWGGTFCLVLFGAVEAILFAWVFGMDRAWTELHAGSDITIPRIYRLIIKYVTPTFLLVILGSWFVQEGWPTIVMRKAAPGEVPYVLATRGLLLAFFIALAVLVWVSWRRKTARERLAGAAEAGASGAMETQGGANASAQRSEGRKP
jgi:SNF family Na+-dependent transporter